MKNLFACLIFTGLIGFAQKSKSPDNAFMREDPFYKAVGHDKIWTVEITGDKISYISILPNESFDAPYSPAKIVGKRTTIKSGAKNRIIEVSYTPKSLLRDEVSLVVTGADGQAKELKGTGQYIPDDRLNVVWILRDMNGKKMTAHDFGKELPYLDLHIHDGFFTGFAGCNRIQGKLALREHSGMQMSEVSASRMQCSGVNKESEFLEMLKRVTHYEIRQGKLMLMSEHGVEAAFNPGT